MPEQVTDTNDDFLPEEVRDVHLVTVTRCLQVFAERYPTAAAEMWTAIKGILDAFVASQIQVQELEGKNNALRIDLELYRMAWPFKLNERVQIAETCEYHGEYLGAEIYFAGATLNRDGEMNVFILSPGEGVTDGWSMDDLEKWTDD